MVTSMCSRKRLAATSLAVAAGLTLAIPATGSGAKHHKAPALIHYVIDYEGSAEYSSNWDYRRNDSCHYREGEVTHVSFHVRFGLAMPAKGTIDDHTWGGVSTNGSADRDWTKIRAVDAPCQSGDIDASGTEKCEGTVNATSGRLPTDDPPNSPVGVEQVKRNQPRPHDKRKHVVSAVAFSIAGPGAFVITGSHVTAGPSGFLICEPYDGKRAWNTYGDFSSTPIKSSPGWNALALNAYLPVAVLRALAPGATADVPEEWSDEHVPTTCSKAYLPKGANCTQSVSRRRAKVTIKRRAG
jgi:hypothetical protein